MTSNTRGDGAEGPSPTDLQRVEAQAIRGGLFTHTALSELAERALETESLLAGLVNLLVSEGRIREDDLLRAAEEARGELEARGEAPGPVVALRVDASDQAAPVPVDCAARMHVCKAVCCRLEFALSAEEVEAGRIKWELGRPYYIRHEEGACAHLDPTSRRCSVYTDRPGVCRRYSCAGDARIWADFDRMELNTDWIEAHLVPAGPRLRAARMACLRSG